jgi:hypothetical protein
MADQDPKATETKAADAKAPETKAPEPKASEQKAPETEARAASEPGQTVDPKASPSNPANPANIEPRTDAADTLTPNPVDPNPEPADEGDSEDADAMTPLEQARADYPPGGQGSEVPSAASILAGQVFADSDYVCEFCGASAFETGTELRAHIDAFHPEPPPHVVRQREREDREARRRVFGL